MKVYNTLYRKLCYYTNDYLNLRRELQSAIGDLIPTGKVGNVKTGKTKNNFDLPRNGKQLFTLLIN